MVTINVPLSQPSSSLCSITITTTAPATSVGSYISSSSSTSMMKIQNGYSDQYSLGHEPDDVSGPIRIIRSNIGKQPSSGSRNNNNNNQNIKRSSSTLSNNRQSQQQQKNHNRLSSSSFSPFSLSISSRLNNNNNHLHHSHQTHYYHSHHRIKPSSTAFRSIPSSVSNNNNNNRTLYNSVPFFSCQSSYSRTGSVGSYYNNNTDILQSPSSLSSSCRNHHRRHHLQQNHEDSSSSSFSFISPFVKYSLFFFNLIFWIIGASLMILGCWSLLEEYDYNMFKFRNIFDFLLHISLCLVISGFVIFAMSLSGCLGALRENLFLIKLVNKIFQ